MIKIKKIQPLFNNIVTTADKDTDTPYIVGTNLIDASKMLNTLREYQTVVAVGSMVKDIKVGDVVCINFDNYAVYKYKKGDIKDKMEEYKNTIVGYSFPTVSLDGTDHLFLCDRDIKYIIEDFEEVKEPKVKPVQNPKILH